MSVLNMSRSRRALIAKLRTDATEWQKDNFDLIHTLQQRVTRLEKAFKSVTGVELGEYKQDAD